VKPLCLALPLIILPTFYLMAQTDFPGDGYQLSTPTYGLARVQSAIQKMGVRHYSESKALSQSQYDSLTLDEKFTYNMIHPEWSSQMCSGLPVQDTAAARIYAQIPNFFGVYAWSDRQRAFFKNNRDSVERLIKAVITKDGSAGFNLLAVIVMTNATDLIPILIETYHRHPVNHCILTTLLLLMNNNQYSQFIGSPQYDQLYNPKYETGYLPYTTNNQEFVIQQASNFYHDTIRS
jgi:hypothetical protein